MDSVLQSWLIERLGPDCVPEAEYLCKSMADGTLLAEVLHSYGIINTVQKNGILASEDPEIRTGNLKILMSYLRAIKIKADDEVFEKVAKEDQTNAYRLLYKVYTKLEPISTLRLEVEQREREVSGKYPPRFTVTKVHESEASSRAMRSINPMVSSLKEKSDIIAWHRAKYEQILNIFKENRKRVASIIGKMPIDKERDAAVNSTDTEPFDYEAARKGIECFTQRCKDEEEKDIPISQLLIEQMRGELLSKDARLDSDKIRDHIPRLRRKIKKDELHRKIKKSIEKVLVSEAWERLTKEQDSEFALIIRKKLLKQSQYEKQILCKLHDIRDEKIRIIKNRTFVQNLIFKESEVENETRWMQEVTSSAEAHQQKERDKLIHIDYQRRLEEEKVRLKKERGARNCEDAISDLIDAAIKTSDFIAKNETAVPQKTWDEWKLLFIKSKPIFDILENIEDILEPKGKESFEIKRRVETHKQRALDEGDFVAYMELKGPWLLEELCPELGVLLETQTILGNIVYRLLEAKYPSCQKMEVDLPPTSVAVCLMGLEDEETLAMLQSLLDMHQVQILQLKYIIAYFISAYQNELYKVGTIDENLIIATERTKAELIGLDYEPPQKDEVLEKSGLASRASKASSITVEDGDSGKNGKKKGKGGKEAKAKQPKKTQLADKEVQTEDEKYKVQLTPTASLGKLAYETLAIGERISDALMTRMLVEYIKENELLGWVLINYPENYTQAKVLEEALVGVMLPSEDEVIETLEILEGVEEREVEYKPLKKKGCSRLVPNTYGTITCEFPKSYLTAYITLKKQSSLDEESEIFTDTDKEYSEGTQSLVNLLIDSSFEKGSDSEGTVRHDVTPAGFSTPNIAKDLKSSGANIYHTPTDTRALGIDIHMAECPIIKKDSVSFKGDIQQLEEDTFGNLEEDLDLEMMSNGEIDGEDMKEDVISEEIQEEEGLRALDKFYLYQGISFKFYYEEFDLQTLKSLARMIIGDSDDITKGSVELFGKVVEELEEYVTKKSAGKDVTWTVKKLTSPQILAKAEEQKKEAAKLEEEEKRAQESKTKDKGSKNGKKKEMKEKMSEEAVDEGFEGEWSGECDEELYLSPEPEEIYMDFYIPQELCVILATMWENLEEVYVKDFKEAFFMKRVYDAAIYPYATFVKENILDLIKGMDNKQIFVNDFQTQFNGLEEDFRSDVEMKVELHARVYELRMALYDIADGHKFNVESERQRIIRSHWVTEHMATISNIFLIYIQLEADRFVDTLQVIQDYYMGMLDKPPAETSMEKVTVTRIELATPPSTPPSSDSEEQISKLLKISSAEDSSIDARENQSATQIKGEDKLRSKNKVVTISVDHANDQSLGGVSSGEDTKMNLASQKAKDTVNTVPDKQESVVVQESPGDIAKNFVETLLIEIEEDPTIQSPFQSVIEETVWNVTNIMDTYFNNQLDVINFEESSFGKADKTGKKWKDRDTSAEAEFRKAQMTQLQAMKDMFFQEWRTVLDSEVERAKARLQLILKRAFLDLDAIIQWASSLFHSVHEQIAERYLREVAAVDELCKVICAAIEDERKIQEELILVGDDFFTRPYILMFPRPSPEESPPVEEPYLDNTFRVEQLRSLVHIFCKVAPSGFLPERALCYILEDLIMCRYNDHYLPPLWYQLSPPEVQELLEAVFGKVEYVEWKEFIIRALGLSYPTMGQVLKMREEFLKYDSSLTEFVSSDTYYQITLWFEKNIPEDKLTQLHIRLAKKLLCSMFLTSDFEFAYMVFLHNFCKDRDPKIGIAKAFALKLGKAVVATKDEYKLYQELIDERQKELDEIIATAKDVMWDITNDAVQTVSGTFIEEILERVEDKTTGTQEQKQVIEEEQKEVIEELVEVAEINEGEQESETEFTDEGENKLSSADSTQILFKASLCSSSTDEEDIKNLLNAQVKIPVEELVNVLTTSLPWYGRAEHILENGQKTFYLKLDQVCEELADEYNGISVYEFLSHQYICDLVDTCYKFHAFHMEDKVELIFITNEYLESLCDQVAELAM